MLHPDRLFDADATIRAMARELYESVKALPILSPHGHVEAQLFAENKPFPDPAQLIIVPDHYVFRMLYSQGIALEDLGVPTVDGSPVETDSRKIWQLFADHFHLFAGTPSGLWLTAEFEQVFGVTQKLNSENAMEVFDQIQDKLQQPEFLPRALYKKFNLEVLSTTDGAADELRFHRQIRESGWDGRIIPCFRPDDVTNLSQPAWRKNIDRLSGVSGISVDSYHAFIQALEKQRAYFKSLGAVSTDHGVKSPCAVAMSEPQAAKLFDRALAGRVESGDAEQFTAHMLMEMARMSVEDGLVMQIHPGSFRNHNQWLYQKFGADRGADIPVRTEYTRNLHELLNRFGNDPRFTLVLFTLDETTYSRELAPLAGHYPALCIGPAWWFNDSVQGMTRHRQQIFETAGVYNTVGFIDDTRAYPSIPTRHDVARRVDANYLAGQVARHIIDMQDARRMMQALAYDLTKAAYKL